MSIIERSNPINLEYRVSIVKSASTPLGVIICKILLKANAFVIGVDSRQKDESLNAGLGTHFQFFHGDMNDENAPNEILQLSRKAFGKENISSLVNIVEHGEQGDLDRLKQFTQAIGKNMQEGLGGCIITVGDADGVDKNKSEPIIDFMRELESQFKDKSIRINVIDPEATSAKENRQSSKAYENARSNMKEIMTSQFDTQHVQDPKKGAQKHYDIGNLTLFLAGDMSEDISGCVVKLDGSYD